MPADPHRLVRFWNELKRRNVIRRNTVFAATAFVILELVSIIQEPLKLPGWTLTLVIILLSIGFLVSIVISWIYDFSPDGGLERTKPLKETGGEQKSTESKSSGWKIASIISFAVILGLILLNIFSNGDRSAKGDTGDHSIAVLPFRNDSPDQEMYFLNGTMEEILDRLSRISDLRVVSRTSVEKYRTEIKTVPEIAGELDVRYILEGSGQRSGDDVRFTVQLMDGRRDTHIWSRIYYRKIDDIFALQSEIAQLVAGELENSITPDKKPQEAKIFSTNETANDLCLKGLTEMNRYWANMKIEEPLDKAEVLFRFALEYDSTLGEAYAQLTHIYMQKYWTWSDNNETYLDSANRFADRALTFDKSIPDVYRNKGWILEYKGMTGEAIRAMEKATLLAPDNLEVLTSLFRLYRKNNDDIKSLEYGLKVLEVEEGSSSVQVYDNLRDLMWHYDFRDLARLYLDKWYAITRDTTAYLRNSATMEWDFGNHQVAREYIMTAYGRDTANVFFPFYLGIIDYYEQHYDEALYFFRKYISRTQPRRWRNVIGHTFLENGMKEEGNRYIEDDLEYNQMLIRVIRDQGTFTGFPYHHIEWSYRDVASIYAYRGEKEKALEYLTLFSQVEWLEPIDIVRINDDPAFDALRDTPEFRQIMSNAKAVTDANREKVRVLLAENELL